MNLMIKGALAAFWLLVIPWACGACFGKKNQAFPVGKRLIAGYCFLFAYFEVLTLPLILLGASLWVLSGLFATGALLAAGTGLYLSKKRDGGFLSGLKKRPRPSFAMGAALLVILLQILVVVLYAHMDADDSFYVGVATTDVATGTIFSVSPYTGSPYLKLPSRYVLSPFPVFLAVVSSLCMKLHPAIMAHTVFPAVFLVLGYAALLQLGRRWFQGEEEKQWLFLLFCAVAIWFSGFSVYTSGNFQMVRIWQGKALLAGVFLPILLALSMERFLEERPEDSPLLLLMANTACCLLSSMGILLAPLLMGIVLLMGLFRFRSLKRLLTDGLCCLPSLLLGIVYLFIR